MSNCSRNKNAFPVGCITTCTLTIPVCVCVGGSGLLARGSLPGGLLAGGGTM